MFCEAHEDLDMQTFTDHKCAECCSCGTNGGRVREGWQTFVLMRMFLPPKVSIRDTPFSASLQNTTGYTSPSFWIFFSYGREKLYATCKHS